MDMNSNGVINVQKYLIPGNLPIRMQHINVLTCKITRNFYWNFNAYLIYFLATLVNSLFVNHLFRYLASSHPRTVLLSFYRAVVFKSPRPKPCDSTAAHYSSLTTFPPQI